MAKSRSSRPARSVVGAVGKLPRKSEPATLPTDLCIQAIQNTGWTPEVEASLLNAPDLLQFARETVRILTTEATRRHDPNLWRLSAAVSERGNEDQDAIRYATEALNLGPNDVETLTLLARLYEKHNDNAASAQWHRRIVDIDPQSLNSNRALAQLYYGRGKYDTAIEYLGRLLDLEPEVRSNKLYWLLATVKSTGLHGLAQPLTRVRRWRNFTEEEELLAHELFVLVGRQCLQMQQRTRAKQYLVRAQQLVPSAEIKALLAEIPDQAQEAAFDRSIATPMLQNPDAIERLAAVLLTDTRGLPTKVWNLFSSALGISASLLAVAVLVLWAVLEVPEQRFFDEDAKVGTSVIDDTIREQPATVITGDASTSFPSAPKPVSTQPVEQSSSNAPTPLSTQGNKPDATTASEIQPQLTSPSITLSDTSSVPSIPGSKPEPAPALKPTMRPPVASAATTLSPAATTPAIGEKQMPAPITSTQPRIAISPDTISTPTKSTASASSSTSSRAVSKLAEVSRPVVESSPTPGQASASRGFSDAPPIALPTTAPSNAPAKKETAKASREAATATLPRQETGKVARIEENDSTDLISKEPGRIKAVPDAPESNTTAPTQEHAPTEAAATTTPSRDLAISAGDKDVAGTVAATERERSMTVKEETDAQEKTLAASPQNERQPAPQEGQEVLAVETSGDEQEVSVGGEDARRAALSVRSVLSASPVIARLSAQSPYTSQFPTRERVVSVPPKKLLPTVTVLMQRETGVGKVNNRGRGVLRARVSGKRPKVDRNGTKTYGQYFVEVLPGPKAGTSRVRAKVIMFDWFTGRPVDDANTLAERFLDKVPE